MFLALSMALAISLSANVFLVFKLIASRKEPVLTADAKDLLQNILSGTAIIRMDVINPSDILIRSPRL